MATKRDNLVGKKGRRKKKIDLEEVYRMIDQGMTVREAAGQIGVSETTLRRRHAEYQEEIRKSEMEMEMEPPEDIDVLFSDPIFQNQTPEPPEPEYELIGKFKKYKT